MFFIIEEAKETFLDFSQGTVKIWYSKGTQNAPNDSFN